MGYKRMHRSEVDRSTQQYGLSIGLRMKFLKELASAILDEIQGLAQIHNFNLTGEVNFYDEVRRFEIDLIQCALTYTDGHQCKAAQLLGLNATTLNTKLKHYGIATKRNSNAATNELAFINTVRELHAEANSAVSDVGVVREGPVELDSDCAHIASRNAKAKKTVKGR